MCLVDYLMMRETVGEKDKLAGAADRKLQAGPVVQEHGPRSVAPLY